MENIFKTWKRFRITYFSYIFTFTRQIFSQKGIKKYHIYFWSVAKSHRIEKERSRIDSLANSVANWDNIERFRFLLASRVVKRAVGLSLGTERRRGRRGGRSGDKFLGIATPALSRRHCRKRRGKRTFSVVGRVRGCVVRSDKASSVFAGTGETPSNCRSSSPSEDIARESCDEKLYHRVLDCFRASSGSFLNLLELCEIYIVSHVSCNFAGYRKIYYIPNYLFDSEFFVDSTRTD